MVQRVLRAIKIEIGGIHEAAYLLGLFAIFSQLLALIRDRLLASSFGAGIELDVYYAAFRIPDFVFITISSLVAISVLVPIFIQNQNESKEVIEKIWNSIFSVLLLIAVPLAFIAWIFTPQLLEFTASGLMDTVYRDELISITRIILLQPLFLSLSNLFGSFAQSYKRFVVYALGPILYNLGIIIGIIFFKQIGLVGLAIGVVLGSILHLLIQLPAVLNSISFPKFTLDIDYVSIKKVLSLSLPRYLILASTSIIMIFFISIASQMTSGSITIFSLAFNLQSVPLSIIGVSYSLAAFPTLSKLYTDGDMKSFIDQITKSAKHIIFWAIPITILFVVLRAQIVRTILGSGSFDWTDTRLTAAALAVFSVSVLAQSLTLLFVRGFYSAGRTLQPFIVSLVFFVITITSTLLLLKNLDGSFWIFIEDLLRIRGLEGTEILVLPISFAIGSIFQAAILWILFDNEYTGLEKILGKAIFQSMFASLIMGFVTFIMLDVLDDYLDINTFVGISLQGFISGIIGILAAILVLVILGNNELKIVYKTIKNRFWKTNLVTIDNEKVGN